MALTITLIQHVTAAHYGITVDEMLGRSKPDHIVFPRHVSMAMARAKLGLSYPSIGKLFGRTHGAVLRAVKAVENRISTEPQARERVEQLAVIITHAMQEKACVLAKEAKP